MNPGGGFLRVSEALRARMADGTYPLGARLPTQRELAEEFEDSGGIRPRCEAPFGAWRPKVSCRPSTSKSATHR